MGGENQDSMPKFSLKRKISSKKTVLSVALSLLLLVCLIVANYLSLMLVRTETGGESVTAGDFKVYMLTLSKSQVEKESISRAVDFRKIGAGGYVWQQNEYYFVVSSVYANRNDAVLVQNSVKSNQGLESEIVEVAFPSFTINGNFSGEEKKVLSKALNAFYELYYNIYDIAISLDTAVYNEISARLAVNNAHSGLSNTIDNFNTMFGEYDQPEIQELSDALDDGLQISKALCGGSPISEGQTYSSLLKYHYTEILALYLDFIS